MALILGIRVMLIAMCVSVVGTVPFVALIAANMIGIVVNTAVIVVSALAATIVVPIEVTAMILTPRL